MAVRYFINQSTGRAKIGHGKAFAAQAVTAGYTEVTAEQFEAFRVQSRAAFRAMVAQ